MAGASLEIKRSTETNGYMVVHVLPSESVLGTNIRPTKPDFVNELATSIRAQGQIQECTGDTLPDGRIRVWAGQHRFLAVEQINIENLLSGAPAVPLRVRAYYQELPPSEILAIQLAENLHNQITPDQEAQVINGLWGLYQTVFKGENISMADLARRIGRGEDKVRDALKFSCMDPDVQQLVSRGALTYSLAVEISRLPVSKQLLATVKIIQRNLDSHHAKLLVKSELGEVQEMPGFFSPNQNLQLAKEGHKLAFRRTADQAAQDATGYFERIIHLMDVLDARRSSDMSDTIKDILARLVKASRNFEQRIYEESPMLAEAIFAMANTVPLEPDY
jgi:ParB-like chromosome segregation protein Spo0J